MKIGIDYIGVSAGAVIINKEGKYFLAKRGNNARDDKGCWEFPGGAIHFHETREEAARRNILQKYGINMKIKCVLGVYDVIDINQKDHWISTTYICDYINGRPTIDDQEKCSELGWFNFDEIQDLILSRITKLNLRDLLAETIS